MDNNTLVIVLGQDKVHVSKKMAQISLYIHNILSIGFDDD